LLRLPDAPVRQTLVHAAVYFGATECLKLITKMLKPLDLDEPDEEGRTALHYAVELGFGSQNPSFLLCVVILVEAGVNVNCRDVNGDTIFHNILQMDLVLGRNPTTFFVTCLKNLLNQKNVHLNATNVNGVAVLDIKKSFTSE
ncbi:Ankyrin repeat-containing domain, partial [Trinorchestia longiramus]